MDNLNHIPVLSEGRFAVYRYDAVNNIGYQTYKENSTNDMTEAEYKEEMRQVVHLCVSNKISKLLADTRNFFFVITPEIQEWTDTNVFAENIYLRKFALIVSEDFIAQLALEQVIEDGASAPFITRFFSDVAVAEEWLKSEN